MIGHTMKKDMKKEEWHHKLFHNIANVLALSNFGLVTWGSM